jgi:hypothetical protein
MAAISECPGYGIVVIYVFICPINTYMSLLNSQMTFRVDSDLHKSRSNGFSMLLEVSGEHVAINSIQCGE